MQQVRESREDGMGGDRRLLETRGGSMDFRVRLRTMRAVQGVSQRSLEKLTAIPNTYLSDFETGKSYPNADWDQRIREALGWTPEVDAALDQLAAALGEKVAV